MKMRSFFRMGVLLAAICLTAAGCGKDDSKQSFRAVLCTSIYISTFVPNLNFGQDEHKRRRQVLCLNGS